MTLDGRQRVDLKVSWHKSAQGNSGGFSDNGCKLDSQQALWLANDQPSHGANR
jgi:hypothetical protein